MYLTDIQEKKFRTVTYKALELVSGRGWIKKLDASYLL